MAEPCLSLWTEARGCGRRQAVVMSSWRRHLLGGVLALLCGVFVLSLVADAWVIDGRGGPDMQCYRASRLATYAGPAGTEATQYRGTWSSVPLGLRCTADTPGDGVPPYQQSFVHWDSTVAAGSAGLVGLVGLALLVVPKQTELQRFIHAISTEPSRS